MGQTGTRAGNAIGSPDARPREHPCAAVSPIGPGSGVIPLVPSITRFARVPVPHTNDATYALDSHGNQWVAKRETDMGCEALLAEALTWLLARHLGVRVPDAAFCDDPAERAWLSRRVDNPNHWSPAFAARIANPTEAGAMIALDAIVFNEARHGRNLLVTALESGSPFTVWAIDADEARVGHVVEYAGLAGAVPDPRIHAIGFPAAQLRVEARNAADAAANLSEGELRLIVEASCGIAREPSVKLLLFALAERCAIARQLTHDYLLRLEARR